MRDHMNRADVIFVPSIVVGELVFGYHNGSRTDTNLVQLQAFLNETRVQVVTVDESVARQYGRLRSVQSAKGLTLATNDLWIAAVCLHLQLPLLTTDRDFERVEGLRLMLSAI